jgi:PAS domain S-box-containing protein
VGAVVVNFRDIHDRKAAEERMLEHSAHFRLLVEGARDYAMMLVDREGRITSWNPGAERILGYAEEEILGRPIGLFFTPEDRALGMDRQELETAARTGKSLVERWHVRKDGSRFFAAGVLSAVPGAGEGPKAFTTILRDITEKRLAEEALLRSQKRFAELVDSIEAIVWEADGATRERTFVSRKARKILGIPAEALLGPADRWEDRIIPPDRWRMREKWAESVRQGIDFVQEYRMLSDQGRRVWLRDQSGSGITLPPSRMRGGPPTGEWQWTSLLSRMRRSGFGSSTR